ncbi:hypothetical protein BDW74DRAFT_28234 [Aspergillus multicolor]|uniref:uncharacterized protein n=1 Tax=Aspergillus multicolor TaxID=41759 RepID=UPI003CCE481D
MANSSTSPQIPQHVSALLSHLTSRPGVQSTLILSRKDGSIIQTTGLLAPPKRPSVTSEASIPAPAPVISEDAAPSTDAATATDTATATEPEPAFAETETHLQSPTSTSTQTQTQTQVPSKPFQPTQAESLAAHIFAFVSSASNLSFALANPLNEDSSANGISETGLANGTTTTGSGSGTGEGEGEGSEGQDEDEVKLLRLRTKKHEIVVVPDRKYLLCVVQDATPAASGGWAAGAGRFAR